MTKTEAKEKAQDILLDAILGTAGYRLEMDEDYDLVFEQMNIQLKRVYKLFGYNLPKDEHINWG